MTGYRWVKVDLQLLDHHKLDDAAEILGGTAPKGRVLAVWLALLLLTVKAQNRGAIPKGIADRLQKMGIDPDPAAVLAVFAQVRVIDRIRGDSFAFHDLGKWQAACGKPVDAPVENSKTHGKTPCHVLSRSVMRQNSASMTERDTIMTEHDNFGRALKGSRSDQIRSGSSLEIDRGSDQIRSNEIDRKEKGADDIVDNSAPYDPTAVIIGRRRYHLEQFTTSKRFCYAVCHAELDIHPDASDSTLAELMKQGTCRLMHPYKPHELTKIIRAVRFIRDQRTKTG